MISCTLTINDTIYDVNPVFGDNVTLEREREDDEMYFTEKLGGEFKFIGRDFDLIESQGLGQDFLFSIYDDNVLFAESTFYKTDCTFDYDSKMVSVKMETQDASSRLREGLDNEYNLVKLAPSLSEATINIRPILQFYMLGDNKITNVIGNMSYELDTELTCDTEDEIAQYGFIPSLRQLYYDLVVIEDGTTRKFWGEYENDTFVAVDFPYDLELVQGAYPDIPPVDPPRFGYFWSSEVYGTSFEIYDTREEAINAVEFTLQSYVVGQGWTDIAKVTRNNRYVCTRILNDKVGNDRPIEDIYQQNLNYRYVIPYAITEERILRSVMTSDDPTEWGLVSDSVKYFQKPIIQAGDDYDKPNLIPIGYNLWGTASFWFISDISWANFLDTTALQQAKIQHAMEFHSVIQVLLNEIDPSISFDATSAYSEFLYGTTPLGFQGNSAAGKRIYITPITNVKKTYYSQAAQRGDITLGQIFEMLKGAYQLYWWVDNSKRLRIEHISYFRNGGSYTTDSRVVRADLTSIFHPRNNKPWAFGQNVISFTKNKLYDRYEFKWSDDATREFNGGAIEVLSDWVSKGKVKRYTISNFFPDLDYIISAPNSVSDDLFAVMELSNSSKRVYVQEVGIGDEESSEGIYFILQNSYLSFIYLIPMYHFYNLSGDRAKFFGEIFDVTNIGKYKINGTMRERKQSVSFPFTISGAREEGLIKTDMGEGEIRKITLNLSSKMAEADIYYDTE